MMGLVATLIMLADISVAQNRFFLGAGYAPGSGENKKSFNTSTTTTSGDLPTLLVELGTEETELATRDLEITLGVRRVFAEQGIEVDFALHRIGMAEINEQTTNSNVNSTTGDSTSATTSTNKYDISQTGATNGISMHVRSIRTEGFHGQGGLEYGAGSFNTETKNTSYVSTSDDVITIGTTANGLISPDNKTSTDHSRLVLSFGPVFVPAGYSRQHGLLFTSISETSETNDPPEGTNTVTVTTETELATGMISYTYRTLGEGNAYFGQIGLGSSEYASVERKTGNLDVADNTTVETKGDGSLLLLTTGVLIRDTHEITLEVQNSTISEIKHTAGTAPDGFAGVNIEQETSTVELTYRFLF